MTPLNTAAVPLEQLESLEQFAQNAGPQLRTVLLSLADSVRAGEEVIVVSDSETVTPTKAAELLGMSRTHVYTLLDSGEIPFHRVGRDRRILVRDVAVFESKRSQGRRELAERFAHQRRTANASIDEIAALL